VADASPGDRWVMTLYVNGASPNSIRAIDTVRRLCREDLHGNVDLDIIDVHQQPALVLSDQIVAAPTLVRRVPDPLRRIVGDLSDTVRLHVSLDLRTTEPGNGRDGKGE
jgi:circadian clock protein KaiB